MLTNLISFFIRDAYCYQQVIVDQAYGPVQLILYSHIPTAIIALFVGIFLLTKNRKLETKIFFFLSFSFFIFTLGDFTEWFMFVGRSPVMFARSIIELLDPILFLLSSYFLFVLIKKRDIRLIYKIIWLTPLVPLIFRIFFNLNLIGYNWQICEVVESAFSTNYIFYIDLFYMISAIIFAIWSIIKSKERKKEITIASVGVCIFMVVFFVMEYVFTGYILGGVFDYNYFLYAFFGMPILIGFLGYLIVKFKTFNVKVMATEALIWALWILIGSILFVAQTPVTKIVTAITEVIAVIFGFILLNSVRREVEQREKLEVLSNELSAANDRLEILDEQKTQFVSFASHDLKSPINIIKQFATLIADGTYKEPVKVQETILKIKGTADRATQMVDDFLDIRKIEEGKMDYSYEIKDIVTFVKGICDDYAPVAKAQKNIDISFMSTTPVINVKMDTTRMRQVFQNYLNNSVKYTEMAAPGAKPNWIKVMVTDEQTTVLISMKDSGMGMSAELLPTLFEQFHRDKNTAKKIQGTGLGLYISKQIVQGHGGETWVESEGLNKGSTFFVRLKKA